MLGQMEEAAIKKSNCSGVRNLCTHIKHSAHTPIHAGHLGLMKAALNQNGSKHKQTHIPAQANQRTLMRGSCLINKRRPRSRVSNHSNISKPTNPRKQINVL
jgi:hypothetical protein